MTTQLLFELVLASAALGLLAHGIYLTWQDPFRRPVALLLWAFLTAILGGVIGSQPHPRPWGFVLPAAILLWEAVRGWKRVPRCHLREAGLGALAAALVSYMVTLTISAWGTLALGGLTIAGILALVGAGLIVLGRFREPAPWRVADWTHYERRASPRTGPSSV